MRAWLLLWALAGCSTSDAGSAVHGVATAGGAAGIGVVNPFLGLVVGIATSVGLDQGWKYGERRIQENVQDAGGESGGPLNVGQSAPWKVTEYLPLTERSGTVEVVNAFGDTFPCKNVIFSVDGQSDLF